MRKEKALFIKSFKTKRLDGHSIRTTYALTKSGIVNIERTIISTELNEGFRQIRKIGRYIYQSESMVFKLESFWKISQSVAEHIHLIKIEDLISSDEVCYKPNEKNKIKLYI